MQNSSDAVSNLGSHRSFVSTYGKVWSLTFNCAVRQFRS
jgi:hypothetical protein